LCVCLRESVAAASRGSCSPLGMSPYVMRNSTSIRFGAAAVFVLLSCVSLLARAEVAAVVCICVAALLDLPAISHSGMRRWLLGVAIRLVVVLAVVGILYFRPLLMRTRSNILFYPVFVVPLGLLMLWSLFWRWRKQRGVSGA
jgi:hypothetical protein